MFYAGIGSRQTPKKIKDIMKLIAKALAMDKYILNTGAAKGADQAFAEGALSSGGRVNLFLPWVSYEASWIGKLNPKPTVFVLNKRSHTEAYEAVQHFHPAPHRLSSGAWKLHARNYLILQEVSFVVCWTPNGATSGGTGMGIRIAKRRGIPIYNLGNEVTYNRFIARLKERGLLV